MNFANEVSKICLHSGEFEKVGCFSFISRVIISKAWEREEVTFEEVASSERFLFPLLDL
jgi:hypothetical protein